MRLHGDLSLAPAVYKDLLYYDASNLITAGQLVCATAVGATEGCGGVIDPAGADACIDAVGVAAEAGASGVSGDQAAGREYFIRTIVNPLGMFSAEYMAETTNTNNTANATGEVITDTMSANSIGDWAYVNGPSTDTAYGNLFKVGAISTTATITNVTGTAYDDELGASTTASTWMHIIKPLVGGVTIGTPDLNSTFNKIDALAAPTGAAIMVIQNYISHKRFPMEPLNVSKHCGKKVPGATFYADIMFTDCIFNKHAHV